MSKVSRALRVQASGVQNESGVRCLATFVWASGVGASCEIHPIRNIATACCNVSYVETVIHCYKSNVADHKKLVFRMLLVFSFDAFQSILSFNLSGGFLKKKAFQFQFHLNRVE